MWRYIIEVIFKNIHSSTIYNSKSLEIVITQFPIGEWIKKICYIHDRTLYCRENELTTVMQHTIESQLYIKCNSESLKHHTLFQKLKVTKIGALL